MSVLKANQKESRFEVTHHLYKVRREITDLLLRDFGFDLEKAEKKALKQVCGNKNPEELTDEEKYRYDKSIKKQLAFDEWFIKDERGAIVDYLRSITREVFEANNFPTCKEELTERRLHQDRAITLCYGLAQELQYAMETLPVDINKYLRFGDLIQKEINLLKAWRKSDNKFKRAFSESATNFANVNNNGNANNNSASNTNGVRPDFNPAIK